MQKNILTCISAAEGTADEPSLTTHKATVLGREVLRIKEKVEHNLPELPGILCGKDPDITAGYTRPWMWMCSTNHHCFKYNA